MIDRDEADEARIRAEKALRDSYKAAFAGGAGQRALEDLRRFCRADSSCIVTIPHETIPGLTRGVDVHATFSAEGRREVWLHVALMLGLDSHTGQLL